MTFKLFTPRDHSSNNSLFQEPELVIRRVGESLCWGRNGRGFDRQCVCWLPGRRHRVFAARGSLVSELTASEDCRLCIDRNGNPIKIWEQIERMGTERGPLTGFLNYYPAVLIAAPVFRNCLRDVFIKNYLHVFGASVGGSRGFGL
jgi:hypothetical protein